MQRLMKSVMVWLGKGKRNEGRPARPLLGLEKLEDRMALSSVPNLAGTTFALYYDNQAASHGLLHVVSEQAAGPAAATFVAVYQDQSTGQAAIGQGYLSNPRLDQFGHPEADLVFVGTGNGFEQVTGTVRHVGLGRDVLTGSAGGYSLGAGAVPVGNSHTLGGYDYFVGPDLSGRRFTLSNKFYSFTLEITSVDVQGHFQGLVSDAKGLQGRVEGTLSPGGSPGTEDLTFNVYSSASSGGYLQATFRGAVSWGPAQSWAAGDLRVVGAASLGDVGPVGYSGQQSGWLR